MKALRTIEKFSCRPNQVMPIITVADLTTRETPTRREFRQLLSQFPDEGRVLSYPVENWTTARAELDIHAEVLCWYDQCREDRTVYRAIRLPVYPITDSRSTAEMVEDLASELAELRELKLSCQLQRTTESNCDGYFLRIFF